MNRRHLLAALGVALAVLVGVPCTALLLALRGPGINRIHCGRIKPGMSREEVEAIFGGPAGFYENGQLVFDLGVLPSGDAFWAESKNGVWALFVHFGEDGRVNRVESSSPTPPTFFERLLSMLP